DEPDEDDRGIEVGRAGIDHEAEPAIGRDQLADHGRADRIGRGNAEPGEDIGDRAGPDDMSRDVALLRAEDAHDVDILRVDGVDAGGGGEENEEEYDRGDECNFRLEIDAEPQNE